MTLKKKVNKVATLVTYYMNILMQHPISAAKPT